MTLDDAFKPREIEVLRLMAEGLSNREIADQLYIGVETVRWYAKQIYSKLGVSGREEAAETAQSMGLLDDRAGDDSPQQDPLRVLPVQLTSFVGREAHIQAIAELLESRRLVTLTGPGGTGKTRLSLKVAEHIADAFADGVYFVDLAPISDSALVATAIAYSLNIKEGGDQSIINALERAIGQRAILLILDNYEQVIEAAPVVSNLLASASHTKIIVTSREPLRVSGEQIYPVPPMTLPDSQDADSAEFGSALCPARASRQTRLSFG